MARVQSQRARFSMQLNWQIAGTVGAMTKITRSNKNGQGTIEDSEFDHTDEVTYARKRLASASDNALAALELKLKAERELATIVRYLNSENP